MNLIPAEEIAEIGRELMREMALHKALFPPDDFDGLCIPEWGDECPFTITISYTKA